MGQAGLGANRFLTALAPSERYNQEQERRHKKLTDWGRQMIKQVRRWLPERALVVVADRRLRVSGSAAVLRHWNCIAAVRRVRNPVHVVTRLRLDAALYKPAAPRTAKQMGRPRLKGARLPNLSTVLTNPKTQWQTLTVNGWYGGGERVVELVTGTAVWYHTGMH